MLPSSLYKSLSCLQSCTQQDAWLQPFRPQGNIFPVFSTNNNEARCFNAGTHKALVTLKCHIACLCDLVWKHHVEPVTLFAVPRGDVPSFASQQWKWSDDGKITLTLNRKGRGFDSRLCHWNFILTSGRPIALVLTQPLTQIITRNISWRVKEAGA